MAAGATKELSLTIKAIDEATGPLRAVAAKIRSVTGGVTSAARGVKGFFSAGGAGKQLREAFGNVSSAMGNIGRQARGLITEFTAAAGVISFALYHAVTSAAEAGDALAKTADRVGLTVDQYAQLGYAADHAGVAQDQFSVAMQQFVRNLGMAKAGSGSLAELLKKVSPAFLLQVQHAKNTSEAFNLMANAIELIPDPTRRAALAAAAFGDSGVRLVPMLKDGAAGVAKWADEYQRIHGSQEKFARGATGLEDVLKDVHTAFDGLMSTLGAEFLPVFKDLATQVRDFIVNNRDGIQAGAKETAAELGKWVKDGGLQKLIDSFRDFAKNT